MVNYHTSLLLTLNLKTLHSAGDVRRGSARKFFTFSRKIFRGGPSGRTRGEGFEIHITYDLTIASYVIESLRYERVKKAKPAVIIMIIPEIKNTRAIPRASPSPRSHRSDS